MIYSLSAIMTILVNVIATVMVVRQLNSANERFLFGLHAGREEATLHLGLRLKTLIYMVSAGSTLLMITLWPELDSMSEAVIAVLARFGLQLVVLGLLHFFALVVVAGVRGDDEAASVELESQYESTGKTEAVS